MIFIIVISFPANVTKRKIPTTKRFYLSHINSWKNLFSGWNCISIDLFSCNSTIWLRTYTMIIKLILCKVFSFLRISKPKTRVLLFIVFKIENKYVYITKSEEKLILKVDYVRKEMFFIQWKILYAIYYFVILSKMRNRTFNSLECVVGKTYLIYERNKHITILNIK